MTDEQREKRIHYHMYDTCEGIAEHAERIVALEELVSDMYGFIQAAREKYPRMFDPNVGAGGQIVREMPDVRYAEAMSELGINPKEGE